MITVQFPCDNFTRN